MEGERGIPPVVGLDQSYWFAAGREMLVAPVLEQRLTAAPTWQRCIDLDPGADPDLRYEEWVVSVVVRQRDVRGARPEDVASPPAAGTACVLLGFGESESVAVSVRAKVAWAEDTDTFLHDLANLWELAGSPARARTKRAVVLCAADLPDPRVLRAEVLPVATVCGYDVEVLRVNDTRTVQTLRGSPPSVLIVESGIEQRAHSVIEAYEASTAFPHLHRVDRRSVRDAVHLGREFRHLAGLGIGLVSVHPRSVESPRDVDLLVPGLPSWRHTRFGTFAQQRDGSILSVDIDGHGGSKYKRFHQAGDMLVWDADLDDDRRVIDAKHKGPTGLTIPMSQLHRRTQ